MMLDSIEHAEDDMAALFRDARASDHGPTLQDDGPEPRAGEVGRRDETVVAAADHQDVAVHAQEV